MQKHSLTLSPKQRISKLIDDWLTSTGFHCVGGRQLWKVYQGWIPLLVASAVIVVYACQDCYRETLLSRLSDTVWIQLHGTFFFCFFLLGGGEFLFCFCFWNYIIKASQVNCFFFPVINTVTPAFLCLLFPCYVFLRTFTFTYLCLYI